MRKLRLFILMPILLASCNTKGGNKYANPALIEMLKPYEDKSAHFTCVITLLNVEDKPLQFKGICPGKILDKPDGENGFGYDPVFVVAGKNMTMAELSEEDKNKISHRAVALEKVMNFLCK